MARLGSIAMFWHSTRIKMSSKLNVKVKHRKYKIRSKNNPVNWMHLSKRSSALFPGVSLSIPLGTVHHASIFRSFSDTSVLLSLMQLFLLLSWWGQDIRRLSAGNDPGSGSKEQTFGVCLLFSGLYREQQLIMAAALLFGKSSFGIQVVLFCYFYWDLPEGIDRQLVI